jgi:hypothetical protein
MIVKVSIGVAIHTINNMVLLLLSHLQVFSHIITILLQILFYYNFKLVKKKKKKLYIPVLIDVAESDS